MKRTLCIVMALLMCMALSSCSMHENIKASREDCTVLIDAVIAGDFEAAYGCMNEEFSREEFMTLYDFMHGKLQDVDEFRLFLRVWNGRQINGVTYVTATYDMYCGGVRYHIDIEDSGAGEGYESFRFYE